jgi:DNA-binding SARP family transcriptional activator
LKSIEVHLLGNCTVGVCGSAKNNEIQLKGYPRKSLAFLLSQATLQCSKESFIEALWPTAPMDQARRRMHVALHGLRGALDPILPHAKGFIGSDRANIYLTRDLDWHCDVDLVEGYSKRRDTLTEEQIEHGLLLFKGPFLDGEISSGWIGKRRLLLRDSELSLRLKLAQLHLNKQAFENAAHTAQIAVDLSPTNEEASSILMRARSALGQRELAIQVYDALRRALRDELDMRVSETVSDLASLIRTNRGKGDPSSYVEPITQVKEIVSEAQERMLGINDNLPVSPTDRTSMLQAQVDLFAYDHAPCESRVKQQVNSLLASLGHNAADRCWIWGAPGTGKTSLLRELIAKLVLEPTLFPLVIPKATIGEAELVAKLRLLPKDKKVVICINSVCLEQDAQSILDKARTVEPTIVGVFLGQYPPGASNSANISLTGLEIWTNLIASTGSSEAAKEMLQACSRYGHAEIISKYPLKAIESLCAYIGGNLAMIDEIAGRLSVCPFPIVGDWLSKIAINRHREKPEHSGAAERLRDFIRNSATAKLSDQEREIIRTLRALSSPLSLFGLADLLAYERVATFSAIVKLTRLGLIGSFRSTKHDVVFVYITGFVSDVLEGLNFPRINLIDQLRIVSFFSRLEFPKTNTDQVRASLLREVLQYESPWLEAALRFATSEAMVSEEIRLSRLLRKHYFDSGRLSAAQQFFNHAIATATDSNDKSDFHLVLGGIYERAGIRREALSQTLTAARLCCLEKESVKKTTIRHNLAGIAFGMGRYKRGVTLMRQVIRKYSELGLQHHLMLSGATTVLAMTNELDFQVAREVLHQTRPTHGSIRNHGAQAWNLSRAYLEFFTMNLRDCARYLKKSKEIGSGLEYVQALHKTSLLEASIALGLGRSQSALKITQEAIPQMLAAEFIADALHCYALRALALVLENRLAESTATIAMAKTLSSTVLSFEGDGLLFLASLATDGDELINDNHDEYNEILVRKFERFPAYIKAVVARQQEWCVSVCGKDFWDQKIAPYAALPVGPMFMQMTRLKI